MERYVEEKSEDLLYLIHILVLEYVRTHYNLFKRNKKEANPPYSKVMYVV